jgi:hypothetical protein
VAPSTAAVFDSLLQVWLTAVRLNSILLRTSLAILLCRFISIDYSYFARYKGLTVAGDWLHLRESDGRNMGPKQQKYGVLAILSTCSTSCTSNMRKSTNGSGKPVSSRSPQCHLPVAQFCPRSLVIDPRPQPTKNIPAFRVHVFPSLTPPQKSLSLQPICFAPQSNPGTPRRRGRAGILPPPKNY